MRDKCYQGGNKHNFEARYDEEPAGDIEIEGGSSGQMDSIKKMCTKRKYVKDICTWCGEEIQR